MTTSLIAGNKRLPMVLDLAITVCIVALTVVNFDDARQQHHVLRESALIAISIFLLARQYRSWRAAA